MHFVWHVFLCGIQILRFTIAEYVPVIEAPASVSTSVSGMQKLLRKEQIMLEILRSYAEELEQKLSTLKNGILKMEVELKKSESIEEAYLSNPLNAFSLVRRMNSDWHSWLAYLKKPVGLDHIVEIERECSSLPTISELIEAIHSIHRIQTTYDLQPRDMAKGLLNGEQYDYRFSAADLLSIGSQLLSEMYILDAKNWLHAALETYEISSLDNVFNLRKETINDLYREAVLKNEQFKHLNKSNSADLLSVQESLINEDVPPKWDMEKINEVYKKACGMKLLMRPYNLNCLYHKTTNDFLKLTPIKMEEISLEPYIVLYYDVLSDHEIEHLKSLTEYKLKRASTYGENGTEDYSDYRTAHMHWVYDYETVITQTISQRITDMTGFNMLYAEPFQAINYGLGGHFNLHTDDLQDEDKDFKNLWGDRISTVIFYMSDVEQGAATVFPFIEVSVRPQKGTALMWHNLDNHGKHVFNTHHAGCPVIVGSKWILTKWISEKNQFLSGQCPKK